MIQMIAQIVADAYKDYAGLDEIKRGIRIAMAVCEESSGISFTDRDYSEIFDEVLYLLDG